MSHSITHQMDKITLLNIPNYYCGFYHLGLGRIAKLRFAPQREFAHLNEKPFLVFDYRGKIIVIDNDDPIGVNKQAYDSCDFYFATNKLKNKEDYHGEKIHPLYPHYPIDSSFNYLRDFGLKGARQLGLKQYVRQLYTLLRRPAFFNHPPDFKEGNYVFFSGRIWKKEAWANQIRRDFIEACMHHPDLRFEGGMVHRIDGDRCGMPESVMTHKFSSKEFSEKSRRSIIGFNNPAVRDAVSWRLAEYFNYSCFVVSFDFKIDLPKEPKHGEEIHYVQDSSEFPDLIDFVLKNPQYRKKVAEGGKSYFERHCLPEIQARRILQISQNG